MGTGEILVILVIILILFGGKKLPEFAQSLGKGIREFKKACYGEESEVTPPPPTSNDCKTQESSHLNKDCQSPTSSLDSTKDHL